MGDPALEVDIGPAQPAQFPRPEAEHQADDHERADPVILGLGEEPAGLDEV